MEPLLQSTLQTLRQPPLGPPYWTANSVGVDRGPFRDGKSLSHRLHQRITGGIFVSRKPQFTLQSSDVQGHSEDGS